MQTEERCKQANADRQRNENLTNRARIADKEHDLQSIIDRTHADRHSIVDKTNADSWSIAKPNRELRT